MNAPNLSPKRIHQYVFSKSLDLLNNKNLQKISIALAFFVIVFIITAITISPKRYDIKVGDVAQETIKAPRDAVDVFATEAKKQQAMNAVPDIYQQDGTITGQILDQLYQVFNIIDQARTAYKNQNSSPSTPSDKMPDGQPSEPAKSVDYESFFKGLPIKLSIEDMKTAVEAGDADIMALNTAVIRLMTQILTDGIKPDSISNAKNQLAQGLQDLNVTNEVRTLGFNIAASLIKPNMRYNEDATQQEKDKAAAAVEKVMIKKGQAIVLKDTVVTESQFQQLRDLGMLKNGKVDISMYMGVAILISALEMVLALYIYWFDKNCFDNPAQLLMLACIMVFALIMTLLMTQVNMYMIPIALCAMLVTVLLAPHIALLANIIASLLSVVILSNDVSFILSSIIGGSVSVYGAMHSQHRNGFILSGLMAGVASMAAIIGLGIASSNDILPTVINGLWALGGGIFAGILAIGTLPVWENLFGVITPIRLLELSNPNQPLLKRLLLEAPGTYHHSILVGNLSESAATAVKGNAILARVAAYYHDVGKLKRPYFFIENQVSPKNPHDKLTPNLSAFIIISHVKDGVELAQKYRLPKLILDMIWQHHGTTLVNYFYHKAKENGNEAEEAHYRYEGPKPQTKEAAILMMADSVEAAVRALPEHTKGRIDGLIRQIIEDKMDDGQLDQCDLTFKDLSTIAQAFSNVLCGIFHQRIEYPKDSSMKPMEVGR